jgi:hypothetical protein
MRRLLSAVLLLGLLTPTRGDGPGARPPLVARPGLFKALVNPNCSHCRDEAKRRAGELRDDDRVLCWIRGYSDGGAIPFRFFLVPYRVISDTYGVFVYDPEAGFARGFEKSLDFDFHGWRNGVLVMRHKDGTLFSALTGLAFAGPRQGERLRPVPTLVGDWGDWLKHYPQAVAYHMFDKYQPAELPAQPSADSLRSRGPADKRLPADTPVLGVADGGKAVAYPLASGRGNLLQVDGDRVILWYGKTRTAAAYRPLAEPPAKVNAKPRPVTLELVPSGTAGALGPWRDRETGSQWDITGRAVAGELTGWTLPWLDGTQVKWFAWAAEYPHTAIFGK